MQIVDGVKVIWNNLQFTSILHSNGNAAVRFIRQLLSLEENQIPKEQTQLGKKNSSNKPFLPKIVAMLKQSNNRNNEDSHQPQMIRSCPFGLEPTVTQQETLPNNLGPKKTGL